MNAVLRFVDAMNQGDLEAVAATFHPEFEMIVPQHPARGFKGRAQEIENMRFLLTSHPEGRIEVLRMAETPSDIWAETRYTADGLEIAAVVIYEVDPESGTIRLGRYYSEAVDRRGPGIVQWLHGLTPPS